MSPPDGWLGFDFYVFIDQLFDDAKAFWFR